MNHLKQTSSKQIIEKEIEMYLSHIAKAGLSSQFEQFIEKSNPFWGIQCFQQFAQYYTSASSSINRDLLENKKIYRNH